MYGNRDIPVLMGLIQRMTHQSVLSPIHGAILYVGWEWDLWAWMKLLALDVFLATGVQLGVLPWDDISHDTYIMITSPCSAYVDERRSGGDGSGTMHWEFLAV